MNRICPNCFREEGVRFNFGGNSAVEAEFHSQHWCNCGYSSPEEMMQDQDLGFDDPRLVLIAKHFLNEYYLRLKQGKINNKDEHIRFFLKLLKSTANNYRLSIELINRKDNEDYEYVYDGKSKKEHRINIFDSSYDLEEVPEIVKFDDNIEYMDDESFDQTDDLDDDDDFLFSENSEEEDDDYFNLRKFLKQDFGFDFPISGGNGNSIDNPIVFNRTENNYDYVGYEYKILECLGKGRRIEWKLITQSLLNIENRKIDKIKIETKQFTDTEIITQIENYYFDVTNCYGNDKPQSSNYNLIDIFFTNTDEYIKFLTSQKSVSIANNEGTCIATLTKEGDHYIYRLDWIKDGKYIGDYIIPFRATQENINKFNQGCKIMAERLALYIATNNAESALGDTTAFGDLTYKKNIRQDMKEKDKNKPSLFRDANDEPMVLKHTCTPDRAGKEMTKEELHCFAVELLSNLYENAGMTIVNVNRNYQRKYPNLVMKSRNGQLYYVIIETACYPQTAESLYSADYPEMKQYAKNFNAIPVFAGMSFMNASSEWDKLVCGDNYIVAFKGLEKI
jgi:hypothetical protein